MNGKGWMLVNTTGRYKAVVEGGKASFDFESARGLTKEQAQSKAREANRDLARARRTR